MDRRFPIVAFDAAKFSEFFGKQTKVLQAELLSGGACNSNYVVQSSKGKFVCRIYSRGNPGLEKSILDLLNDSIPAPEYLWVGDGVSVMNFIEGQHFEPTQNLMREAGRIIARLSKMEFNRPGQILSSGEIVGFDGWSSYRKSLPSFLELSPVREYLDEKTIFKLSLLLDECGDLLDSFDGCKNLVHGDFNTSNILVANDSIVGVLDWEFAHSGSSYIDMGNLMRHIPREWQRDFATGLSDEGFELPSDWLFRASLIDLTSHLEFLTSNTSDEFKNTCVECIHRLIKLNRKMK